MTGARLRIHDIQVFQRVIHFAHPFRFGLATVEAAPQAFVRVTVEIEDGGIETGVAAEMMMPKWFDKNLDKTPQDTVSDLKSSLLKAADLYTDYKGWETAFGHHARAFTLQKQWAAERKLPGLVASFGPALIDKAVADGALKALNLDFGKGLRSNALGIDARLTPDLDTSHIHAFLGDLHPVKNVTLRHTIGLADELEGEKGLVREIAQANLRLFKIKIGGNVEADIARLLSIHDLLSHRIADYRATLDANEQYDSERLKILLQAMASGRLAIFREHLLYIEQPFDRSATFETPLGDLGREIPLIIDEADEDYDAFPRAISLGYRGTSSKACKGFYKSILNSARVAALAGKYSENLFISAEDLTCQAGLGIQQDSALVAALGLTHAERNGHHYVQGFGPAPRAEAARFAAAHPALYHESNGKLELNIRSGAIPTASLFAVPGFASGAEPDWSSLHPLSQHSH